MASKKPAPKARKTPAKPAASGSASRQTCHGLEKVGLTALYEVFARRHVGTLRFSADATKPARWHMSPPKPIAIAAVAASTTRMPRLLATAKNGAGLRSTDTSCTSALLPLADRPPRLVQTARSTVRRKSSTRTSATGLARGVAAPTTKTRSAQARKSA